MHYLEISYFYNCVNVCGSQFNQICPQMTRNSFKIAHDLRKDFGTLYTSLSVSDLSKVPYRCSALMFKFSTSSWSEYTQAGRQLRRYGGTVLSPSRWQCCQRLYFCKPGPSPSGKRPICYESD